MPCWPLSAETASTSTRLSSAARAKMLRKSSSTTRTFMPATACARRVLERSQGLQCGSPAPRSRPDSPLAAPKPARPRREPPARERASIGIATAPLPLERPARARPRERAAALEPRCERRQRVAVLQVRAGRYTVKVLPSPGVLESVTSPPSSRTSSRLIDRPRPVPPYWRAVEPSAWANASKMSCCCSGRDADAGVC